MEKGVTRYLEEHTKDNPWEQTASLAVFVGKGKKRGADIFTVEAFAANRIKRFFRNIVTKE